MPAKWEWGSWIEQLEPGSDPHPTFDAPLVSTSRYTRLQERQERILHSRLVLVSIITVISTILFLGLLVSSLVRSGSRAVAESVGVDRSVGPADQVECPICSTALAFPVKEK